MKQGTVFAARLRKAFARERAGAPEMPNGDHDDPVFRLCAGILGTKLGEDSARVSVQRLLDRMIDWNEVRVSLPSEIQEAMGIAGGTNEVGQRVRDALQDIYYRENRVSLDRLKNLGRREARQYLEELKGVDAYAAAAVVLWSLGGHAIPVDDRLLNALRAAELIHPEATREEVQAFLERNISATDAKEFCWVMRKFSPGKAGAERAGRKSKTSKERKKAKS